MKMRSSMCRGGCRGIPRPGTGPRRTRRRSRGCAVSRESSWVPARKQTVKSAPLARARGVFAYTGAIAASLHDRNHGDAESEHCEMSEQHDDELQEVFDGHAGMVGTRP